MSENGVPSPASTPRPAALAQWGSRAGFVLTTIGAAVGLGNIWRFSYVAGENGGGAFLLVYVVFVIAIGLPLLMAELALGRRGGSDAVAAFAGPDGGAWRWVGWLGVAGATLILSYYAVIAGWALKYFVGAATGTLWEEAAQGYGGFFARFIADRGEPLAWQAAMLLATVLVVSGGVQRGIERANTWLMPLLVLIVLGLAGFSLSLPGSAGGVAFLFAPDWSALGRLDVYIAALGQAFFSIGVGMAVFITYGAYTPREFRLPRSSAATAAGDTVFALLAGLAIFPAVFALAGDPAAGPQLAFITLPQVFLHMPAGAVVGAVFFFLLSAAALTSMVALLEVVVAVAVRRLGLARRSAALGVGALVFALGVPSALSYGVLDGIRIADRPILDFVDHMVSDFVLPLGGLLIALFVGWRVERALALADVGLTGSRLGALWLWSLRVLAPLTIAALLLRALLGT